MLFFAQIFCNSQQTSTKIQNWKISDWQYDTDILKSCQVRKKQAAVISNDVIETIHVQKSDTRKIDGWLDYLHYFEKAAITVRAIVIFKIY